MVTTSGTLGSWIAVVVVIALGMGVSAPAPGRAAASIAITTNSNPTVTGRDDLRQLKHLTSGVGWEFEPNAATTEALRRVGIKTLRCINVEPSEGTFDQGGKFTLVKGNGRLETNLAECQSLGAIPHIIVAQRLPQELLVKEQDLTDEALKELVRKEAFGPTDWTKFRGYYEAFFEYVLITRGFSNAQFEVANEPDIQGAICPFPPKPRMGSQALYDASFNLYKNVAAAAVSFEQKHPGVHVKLGGPALAWAFSFKYGDFNWTEHFLRDCGEQKLKLDFLGLHFYGNNTSLNGEYSTVYPSFAGMMSQTQGWINAYTPRVPIYLTEWGPAAKVTNSAEAMVNANNIGAAWAAAFLNAQLVSGVNTALYLVTTDLRRQEEGKWVNMWGWPSLFLNPVMYDGKALPKPMYHLFEMISRLEGRRIEVVTDPSSSQKLNCFASADSDKRKVTLLVWNYDAVLPENAQAEEKAVPEETQVSIGDAGSFFHSPQVKVETWQISEATDNIPAMLTEGVQPDENNTAMAQLPTTTAEINQGGLDLQMLLPPSSVSLVVLTESGGVQ